MSSTIQAVLQPQINFRYLKQQQIEALKTKGSHCKKLVLNRNSKEELQWWIQNFKICNGCYLIQSHSQVLIQTDASIKGRVSVCQGISTEGQWSKEEQLLHINILELKAVKLALLTFNKKISEGTSFSNRQHPCTILPCENGGSRESIVTEIKQINLAVFREIPNHNNCRIPSKFFECGGRLAVLKQQGPIRMQTLPKSISTSLSEEGKIYLFASRLPHQLPQYFVSKPDPFSQGKDVLQQI